MLSLIFRKVTEWKQIFFRAEMSKNNVKTVNTNIYLCGQKTEGSPVFGLAYFGGACESNTIYKCHCHKTCFATDGES